MRSNSMISFVKFILVCFIFFTFSLTYGQWGPSYTPVKVIVSADHNDWNYKLGESVLFSVSVYKNGNPIEGKVNYQIMPEKMEPVDSGSLQLKNGSATLAPRRMNVPGYLRCKVTLTNEGKIYEGMATVAFSSHQLIPTTTMPEDFEDFWRQTLLQNKDIPLNSKLTKIEELSDEKLDVYHVKFQNYKLGSYIYGVLSVPKNGTKFPALIKVPGAGVWSHFMFQDTDALKGMIVLDIRIHGIPIVMNDHNEIYGELWNAALNDYWTFNLDNKELYYYRRVYSGCVKAVDFIHSLPQFNQEDLGVSGGSQGGALAIVMAALDQRVDYLVSYYPALCDLTGYLNGRAGGWPHLFDKKNSKFHAKSDKIETSKYYDVVNFARILKVPGYYCWGYNDESCPPTSMQSMYNVISAPKELSIMKDAGHYTYPEQKMVTDEWIYQKLSGIK